MTTYPDNIFNFNAEKLRKYAADVSASKADMDEARGEVGQIFKQIEDDGFDKAAFKFATKVKKMDSLKGQGLIVDLLAYMLALDVFGQFDMFRDNARLMDLMVEIVSAAQAALAQNPDAEDAADAAAVAEHLPEDDPHYGTGANNPAAREMAAEAAE